MIDFRLLLRRTPSGAFFHNLRSEADPNLEVSIQAGHSGLYACPRVISPDPFIYTHFEVGVIRNGELNLDEHFEYYPVDAVQDLVARLLDPNHRKLYTPD